MGELIVDDYMEELLAEGPANDEEAYELEKYIHSNIEYLSSLKQQNYLDIEDIRRRDTYLSKEIDEYRKRAKAVFPDFGY